MSDFNELIDHTRGNAISDWVYDDLLFARLMRENLSFQRANCPAYKTFLENRAYESEMRYESLSDFPFIPVQYFKQVPHLLRSNNSDYLALQSSATSGVPSKIFVDKGTAKRQSQSMAAVMLAAQGGEKKPYIVFDVDPRLNNQGIAMGARKAATLGFLKFASSATFLLEENNGELVLRSDILEVLQGLKGPVVCFGFTYVLYQMLINCPADIERSLAKTIEVNSLIHIGGWKKLESEKVSKTDFNALCNAVLGVPAGSVIDVYGFTEQLGLVYPSFGNESKVVSPLSRIIVRDPQTFQCLPSGEEGVLQFLSPMPMSYPGLSVLTDDVGYKIDEFSFVVTGRLKNSEIRGCGDVMGSSLAGIQKKSKQPSKDNSVVVGNYTTGKYETISIVELEKRLEHLNRLSYLENCKTDLLLEFFAEFSKRIQCSELMQKYSGQGIEFIQNWLRRENLIAMLSDGMDGNYDGLDREVVSIRTPSNKLFAPRGIAVHWLAGNVPLLGVLSLVLAVLTRNKNILKAPSANPLATLEILREMYMVECSIGGEKLVGSEILEGVLCLSFDKNNRSSSELISRSADVRIAWGGAEAVETIVSLPRASHCEDIIFGPKYSLAVIDELAINTEQAMQRTARRLAVDSCVYDQKACASPHVIFIETRDKTVLKTFGESLFHEMRELASRLPIEALDGSAIGRIQEFRAKNEFQSHVFLKDDLLATVIVEDECGQDALPDPTFNRVVRLRAVNSVLDIVPLLGKNVQTIGLDLSGSEKFAFCSQAMKRGVNRFPAIGRMTHFQQPWDGFYLINRLLNAGTIGGPF